MLPKWDHKCSYKREAEGDLAVEEVVGDDMAEARGWSDTRQEYRQPPGDRKDEDSPQKPLEGTSTADPQL